MTLRQGGKQVDLSQKSKRKHAFDSISIRILYCVHTHTHNKDQRNKEAGECTVEQYYTFPEKIYYGVLIIRSSYKVDVLCWYVRVVAL
jgi:hypothetical protein